MRDDLMATSPAGVPVLLEVDQTPFGRAGLRQRLGPFALVALAAEASVALPPGPASIPDTIVSVALLLIVGLLIALPWQALPAWATVIVPIAYAGSVLGLILAAGGSTSGVGILVLVPLIWTPLYHRRWESAVVVVAVIAIELVTSLTPIIQPGAVIARRLVFWGVLGFVVSFAIHGLRDRLRATFSEREQLYVARTGSLRRMVSLQVAAEELTSILDPQEVLVTATRLAAELASSVAGGAHSASYMTVDGDVARTLTRNDETQPETIAAAYPLSEHPRLEQAARTGEENHGSLDRATLGPAIRPLIEMLDITHSIYLPVMLGGTVHGVLVISLRDLEPSSELVEHCKAVGHLTELALGNAYSHKRERDLATTDALTGLANRRSFEQLITERPGRAPFTIVVIDVDGLKEVNDTQGHLAGDALLKEVAAVLSGVVRRGDVLARIGGDEFAVLSFEADLPAAEDIGQRMLEALQQTTVAGTTPRASIGIASGNGDADAVEVFHAADAAMYAAKREGGERFAVAQVSRR
jgi:diguanylate cyclase (GGDEF)-like protein